MREDKLYLIGVVSDVSNLYDLILKEKEKNMKDTLPNAINKNGFKELCKKISGQKPRPSYTFIMIDLDDFKAINDNFGHETGDKVLLETVKQLREFFPRPSLIGRFGGDEFMVLCPFHRKSY